MLYSTGNIVRGGFVTTVQVEKMSSYKIFEKHMEEMQKCSLNF